MSTPAGVFGFELDFAGELYCIPMSVRRKLDLAGVKVSLRQWNRFTLEDRQRLLASPCDTPAGIEAYRQEVARLVEARVEERPQFMEPDSGAEWNGARGVPPRVIEYCVERGVPAPDAAQWMSLSADQRFAVFKLTRPGHRNENFLPAMREFRLVD